MWYRLVHKYSKLNHCTFPWYCAKHHTFNLHEMPCWLSYPYMTKKHKRGCPSHAARLTMSFNAGPSSFDSYPALLGFTRLQEFLKNTNEAITCPLLGGRKLWISQNFMLERKAQSYLVVFKRAVCSSHCLTGKTFSLVELSIELNQVRLSQRRPRVKKILYKQYRTIQNSFPVVVKV